VTVSFSRNPLPHEVSYFLPASQYRLKHLMENMLLCSSQSILFYPAKLLWTCKQGNENDVLAARNSMFVFKRYELPNSAGNISIIQPYHIQRSVTSTFGSIKE